MFIFNDQAALYRSIKHNFMGLDQGRSDVECIVFYMTGTPPTSYNALPFDTKDPYEVSRQCVGTDHLLLTGEDALQRFKLNDTRFRVGGQKFQLFKQHFFDSTRSLWRVMPQSVLMERAIEEYDPASRSSVDGLYSDVTLFPKVFYADTDPYLPGNTENQFYMNRSRYPYAWPYLIEFDQVVTLDRIALMQTHSGSSYDNTGMTIEHWDPTLNEGAGDWTNVQSVSYGGGNTQNEIDLTGRGLTSNKFRIKGNDTGSQPWVGKYFAFYTSTEPTITPFDVTWALIGPSFGKAVSVFGSSFNFDAVLEDNGYAQPEIPFMLASVGSPQTEGLLVLSQAENISDKTIIDTRLFTLAINNTES